MCNCNSVEMKVIAGKIGVKFFDSEMIVNGIVNGVVGGEDPPIKI